MLTTMGTFRRPPNQIVAGIFLDSGLPSTSLPPIFPLVLYWYFEWSAASTALTGH
jgi:hypothetical protein